MNFHRYQAIARTTAVFPPLASEAGEVAGRHKKILRKPIDDSGDREDHYYEMALEMGDVLWYLSLLSDLIGYPLETIAEMNIVKLNKRKELGTLADTEARDE